MLLSCHPFDFRPRTRIVFGEGTLDQVGELARSLGGRRALIVSDPGVVAVGYPERARERLETAGLKVFLYSDIQENPTTRHVDHGVAVAREHSIDLLIGLGGGSSMDCAKGINFLLTNGGRMADYWGTGKATEPMLPLIEIPTTAGTGSEAQSFALIADAETHQKMACGDPKAAAAVAILDPALTLSQPRRVTAMTGIDAVSHAVETWVTRKRNPISRMYAGEAWRLLRANFPRVMQDPADLDARAGMLLGANFAGTAIENSMLGAAHSCANPLTAHFDVVHGAAVGLMLPAVVRFNGSEFGPLYSQLPGATDGAFGIASEIEEMVKLAGLPTRLSEHGIAESALPVLAEEAARQWTANFNPRQVTAKDLLEIYQCVY